MLKKLYSRVFRRKTVAEKPQSQEHQQRKQNAEFLRFAMKQLSVYSNEFPRLTGIHNKLLKEKEFHSNCALKITGDEKTDLALSKNFKEIMKAKKRISFLELKPWKKADVEKNLAEDKWLRVHLGSLEGNTKEIFRSLAYNQ